MLSNQARSRVVRVGVLAVILCALTLSACGTTPTPVPVAVAPTATEAATATATSTPTSTSTATPTATLPPTVTYAPTSTSTPTPEPTATPIHDVGLDLYLELAADGQIYRPGEADAEGYVRIMPIVSMPDDNVYATCMEVDSRDDVIGLLPPDLGLDDAYVDVFIIRTTQLDGVHEKYAFRNVDDGNLGSIILGPFQYYAHINGFDSKEVAFRLEVYELSRNANYPSYPHAQVTYLFAFGENNVMEKPVAGLIVYIPNEGGSCSMGYYGQALDGN